MNISTIEWNVATDEHCLDSGTSWPSPAKLGPQIKYWCLGADSQYMRLGSLTSNRFRSNPSENLVKKAGFSPDLRNHIQVTVYCIFTVHVHFLESPIHIHTIYRI
jgi:hypothetical protein